MSLFLRAYASLGAAGLVAGMLAIATPAAAQSRVIATFSKLEAVLTGQIVDRCEVGGGASIDFGELTGRETAVADFALECNLPFDLGLEAARGGLTHATLPMGQGPYAGQLLYTVDVKVPTRISANVRGLLEGRFSSADLVGKKTISSGDAIAAGGGELTIRTLAPRGAGLLAGDYSDSLMVTVASRL